MTKRDIFFVLTISVISGAISSVFISSINEDYDNLINQMAMLKEQIDSISLHNKNLNNKINNLETGPEKIIFNMENKSDNISSDTKDADTNHEYHIAQSHEETELTKNIIYDFLASGLMTIPEALSSQEYKSLPENVKNDIAVEIVKRYNSNELPR